MYDPSQLRTFLAVAQTLSFTQAARRLGLRQSTVSQHVRRLEDTAGRQLFTRDTHSVELTEDGEAMLGFARRILEVHEQAAAFFTGTRLRGRLRFGASEDFVLTRLTGDPGGLPARPSRGGPGADGRAVRHAARAAGGGKARPGAGQAAPRGPARRTGLARPPGVDRRGTAPPGPRPPGPADRLPAAGHHPRPRPGGPGTPGPRLAHRLHERQPQRTHRGGPRGPRRDGPLPRARSRRVWSASRSGPGCRNWARSTSSCVHGDADTAAQGAADALAAAILAAGTGCTGAPRKGRGAVHLRSDAWARGHRPADHTRPAERYRVRCCRSAA